MSLWQSLTWYLLYLCCRFHEHWRFVLQRLVFLAAFVVYLETETLVTREAVTEILGSKCLCVICRVLYISLGFGVKGTIFCVCECVHACVCVCEANNCSTLFVCVHRMCSCGGQRTAWVFVSLLSRQSVPSIEPRSSGWEATMSHMQ